MDAPTIASIAAGLGVLATIIYLAIGMIGIKTLRNLRDEVRRRGGLG